MNFDSLNKMIKYIENNLDSEIDYNILSKITNTNRFILERIFMFLTNMTITDYIKKRRLSKAFEDIRNTELKITDIAFKYQYNSSTSFNRAFKKVFNITPTDCRKKVGNYKIIPMLYFEKNQKYNFDYEIKKLDSINLSCYHVSSKSHDELLYEIKKLYKKVKNNGYYKEFNKIGMYGVFLKDKDDYHYYLGSKRVFDNLEKYKIKENEYAVFKMMTRMQKDIVELERRIDIQWFPSTNYKKVDNIKIELYKDDYCYLYLPIK